MVMVKVKVRYFGRIRELLGVKEEEYDVGDISLGEFLLKHISSRHEGVGEEWVKAISPVEEEGGRILFRGVIVLVNGEPQNTLYKLRDGDIIAVLPPVGGG